MSRNAGRPMTDAEIEGLREEIRDQRGDLRDYLESEGVDVSTWGAPAADSD